VNASKQPAGFEGQSFPPVYIPCTPNPGLDTLVRVLRGFLAVCQDPGLASVEAHAGSSTGTVR
jgi:hypothetical protein